MCRGSEAAADLTVYYDKQSADKFLQLCVYDVLRPLGEGGVQTEDPTSQTVYESDRIGSLVLSLQEILATPGHSSAYKLTNLKRRSHSLENNAQSISVSLTWSSPEQVIRDDADPTKRILFDDHQSYAISVSCKNIVKIKGGTLKKRSFVVAMFVNNPVTSEFDYFGQTELLKYVTTSYNTAVPAQYHTQAMHVITLYKQLHFLSQGYDGSQLR